MAPPTARMITVGGLPGTGTSTLCKLLEEQLGLPYTYAGQLFRAEAAARNMTLAEFGALCEADPSVDKALDAKQVELLQGTPLILEGRLSGWLAHENNIPTLKVWVICEEKERIRRITERDGGSQGEQAAKTLEREASERARYESYYGIDLADLSPYDLVLDSTNQTPDELCAAVITATS